MRKCAYIVLTILSYKFLNDYVFEIYQLFLVKNHYDLVKYIYLEYIWLRIILISLFYIIFRVIYVPF